jgi:protein phosphatase 1L
MRFLEFSWHFSHSRLFHRPQFLILASDGLWDCFTNEEAVAYIRDHLHEPHFGAKSITLQSYARGSVDNISTIVIVFTNGVYQMGSSKLSEAESL